MFSRTGNAFQGEAVSKPSGRVVRYHPPTGLSRLFRPLPKASTRPVLDVRYAPTDADSVLRFSAREALGVAEQSMLLVLLEIAQEQLRERGDDALLDAGVRWSVGAELWRSMYQAGAPSDYRTVVICTSWAEVNRRLGHGNGGALIGSRREALRRLCEVVVWEENSKERTTEQSYLVALLQGIDRRLYIALNHRLASSVMGRSHYVQVCLDERFTLSGDLPKALHAFLSTAVKPGASLEVGLGKLVSRMWDDDDLASALAVVQRRKRDVQRALQAIGRLEAWEVRLLGDKATVRRRDPARREMTCMRRIASPKTSERVERQREFPLSDKALTRPDVSGLFATTSKAHP